MLASQYGHVEIMDILLEAGALIEAKDDVSHKICLCFIYPSMFFSSCISSSCQDSCTHTLQSPKISYCAASFLRIIARNTEVRAYTHIAVVWLDSAPFCIWLWSKRHRGYSPWSRRGQRCQKRCKPCTKIAPFMFEAILLEVDMFSCCSTNFSWQIYFLAAHMFYSISSFCECVLYFVCYHCRRAKQLWISARKEATLKWLPSWFDGITKPRCHADVACLLKKHRSVRQDRLDL